MGPSLRSEAVTFLMRVKIFLCFPRRSKLYRKAADQGAGRASGARRHRSPAAGGVMVVCIDSRHWLGVGVGTALRGERAVPLAVRRGDGESPLAVGFPHRSGRCAGGVVYASDRVVSGSGTDGGEPHPPGRSAGASGRGGEQFPLRRAVTGVIAESQATRGGVAASTGIAGAAGQTSAIWLLTSAFVLRRWLCRSTVAVFVPHWVHYPAPTAPGR